MPLTSVPGKLAVLQIGGSLAVESGGMAAACASLANHLSRAGARLTAVSLATANGSGKTWALDPDVEHIAFKPLVSRLGYCPGLAATLAALSKTSTSSAPSTLSDPSAPSDRSAPSAPSVPSGMSWLPDVVHLHGLWRHQYLQGARYALRAGVPIVLSTHGMVHERALNQRRGLKSLASLVCMGGLVRRARCLHATSQQEREEIARFGYDGPVAVIPWGVDLPLLTPTPSHPRRERVTAYLGRFHPSKGVDRLIRAWARVANRPPCWRLALAGYDEGGYQATLAGLVETLNLGDSVTFTGPVEGSERERFFADAELMVLPSPAENFGFVVPEALARGVPVITTRGTPWAAVATEGCGWWVPDDEDALVSTLEDALGRAPAALGAMGERGRSFARAHFGWPNVTRQMMDLYAWVAGKGERPEFVQLAR